MSFIAICGGGGKSYICNKYPDKFLDLDVFIYDNIKNDQKKILFDYIENNDFDKIGQIYKDIMIKNKNKLINLDKIVLGHHPINAEYLDLECIDIIKPNKELHEKNIQFRENNLKEIARNCWNNLYNSYIYKSHSDFEDRLLLHC